MSSSVHTDNEGKGILILDKGITKELNHALAAEALYSINFIRPGKKICLTPHYYGSKSFLFVNATKIYQFKAKVPKKEYSLCLENISGDFSANNMKKKQG